MQWFLSLPASLQALLVSAFMYAMTALGAACVFFSKKPNAAALTLCAGFAAGIMIAASFFSLLLPALEYDSVLPNFVTVTIGFLLGGAFIIVSDLVFTRKGERFNGLGGASR